MASPSCNVSPQSAKKSARAKGAARRLSSAAAARSVEVLADASPDNVSPRSAKKSARAKGAARRLSSAAAAAGEAEGAGARSVECPLADASPQSARAKGAARRLSSAAAAAGEAGPDGGNVSPQSAKKSARAKGAARRLSSGGAEGAATRTECLLTDASPPESGNVSLNKSAGAKGDARRSSSAAGAAGSVDVEDLLADAFPGRAHEIRELLSIFGGACDFFPPVLVYGGASTGKTSVVKELLKRLNRPHAYASCRSCHTPRILFESLLNSLVGHVRSAENNYSSFSKCERASDFVELLPSACERALQRTSGSSSSSENNQLVNMFGSLDWFKSETRVVYLIIDNIELIRNWSGGTNLLSVLFRLPELTRLPQLGLILISSVAPFAFMSGTGSREPLAVCFRDYLDEQLFQILLSKQRNSDLYVPFLNAVLKPFTRATRRVTELAGVLEPLFEKYCEPVVSGAVDPDEKGKRKLFTLIKPHVKTFLGRASCILTATSPGGDRIQDPIASPGGSASTDQIVDDQLSELQLPVCSKYLLLSAYIASTNPATLDAALFEAGGGNASRKRKRKSSLSAMEKKDKELHERQLKGPGSFSLERLLAIFSCIATLGPGLGAGSQIFQQQMSDSNSIEITGDVLMQISTLVGFNLISQGLTDPLEGAPKLRCNVDEELIHKVARSIRFPLSKYLYYNC